MKRLIAYLLGSVFLLSCNSGRGKIETAIAESVEKCNNGNCIVTLKSITHFDWDRVYFFEVPISREFINSSIGLNYIYYEEFTRPIIFIRNGKIVYHENNKSSIESILEKQIVIGDISDTSKYKTYTPADAVFKGEVKKENNTKYYELTPQ